MYARKSTAKCHLSDKIPLCRPRLQGQSQDFGSLHFGNRPFGVALLRVDILEVNILDVDILDVDILEVEIQTYIVPRSAKGFSWFSLKSGRSRARTQRLNVRRLTPSRPTTPRTKPTQAKSTKFCRQMSTKKQSSLTPTNPLFDIFR
jgi:hypothetical protein